MYQKMSKLKIPDAPMSIKKGVALKNILGKEAVKQMAVNIQSVYSSFDSIGFADSVMDGIEELSLTERSKRISNTLRNFLPQVYAEAVAVLLKTLTPALEKTEGNGLAPLYYMPYCNYIATYGVDDQFNNGINPFEVSMDAQYELTKRFTCEFSIRPFLVADEKRTMKVLGDWLVDPDPHVRRLCSEGTRSRLPWAMKIDSFVKNPSACLPILEKLKNDPDLYVRRSVANHVGDIAKDHLDLALDLCEKWLDGASKELKWVIRHAVRNPVKKGNERAIALRVAAK